MIEINSIQLQVDKFVLSLGSRVTRIYDTLYQLERLTQFLFRLTPRDEKRIQEWLQTENFQVDADGYFQSLTLLENFRAKKAPASAVSYFWNPADHENPEARFRMYAVREIGPQLLRIRESLEGVAWIYYQDVTNTSIQFPFIDMKTAVPPDFSWHGYHTFISVEPGVNPERAIRWTPPSIDYANEGLIASASIPVWLDDTFVGLWSVDVPLRTIHRNCIHETVVPAQSNFIVEYSGDIVIHESIETEINKEKGSVHRKRIKQLGGDFENLDLKEIISKKSGLMEVLDSSDERLMVIYSIIPDIQWIFFATCPKSRMLAAIQSKIKEAFERIKKGDLSHRIDSSISDEMQQLIDGCNEMAAALEANRAQRELADLERRSAEAALAAEKERLAVTLLSIGEAVITTDHEENIVLLNKVAENLTGWNQADAVGRHLNEVFRIVHAKTRKDCENAVQKVLKTGQTVEFSNNIVLISRGGAEYIISASGAPIRDKSGRIIGIVLVFRDTTEQHKIAEELQKANKLESVGVLAGGIAHDFNNILMSILGNLSLARIEVENGNPAEEILHDAEVATHRAKELAQQLLTFSKGGAPIKKTASLVDLIKDTTNFVLRGSNVKVEFSIPDDLWPVEADEGQISQVINNLVLNAQQAMPKGGTLRVQSQNIVLGEGSGEAVPLSEGKYIKICIQDEGIGIPEEFIQKIFDPYFTTKQKGSGLGLATSYSIIKNHGGLITVTSKMVEGTSFFIYLPASRKKLVVRKSQGEITFTGKGKVLVIDDEESVRKLIGKMLRHMGFEVDVTEDGKMGVDLYRQALEGGQRYDLVLLDLTIPGGMGGKEAIQHLIRIDPSVRAIVSSGYSNDPVMAHFRDHHFCGVVAKPYEIAELKQVIRRALSEPENSRLSEC